MGFGTPAPGPEAVGATCPYDHAVIKPGQDYIRCPRCGTAHHADCWKENCGCAVLGCDRGANAQRAHDARTSYTNSTESRGTDRSGEVPELTGMSRGKASATAQSAGFSLIVSS